MIKNTVLILLLSLICHAISAANDTLSYSIHIIDYSNSYEYDTHYIFDEMELKVYEESKLEKGEITKMISHRQLFGREKTKIRSYLTLLSQIKFGEEYSNNLQSNYEGQRNQKRISFRYGDTKRSILVSNFYQKELAEFIVFLNTFLKKESSKMIEFTN